MSCVLARRHSVFLSSTFLDLRDLRAALIDRLQRSDLLLAAMERFSASPNALRGVIDTQLQRSDVLVLLVDSSNGSGTVRGPDGVELPATQYEFREAMRLRKPVLAYLRDRGRHGDFPDSEVKEFKTEIASQVRYAPLRDTAEVSQMILSDLLALLQRDPPETSWVRSDLSANYLSEILRLQETVRSHINKATLLLSQHAPHLREPRRYHELLGPLVDAGIYTNVKNATHAFVVPPRRRQEAIVRAHQNYEFQYFVDRFDRFENDVVYDKMLKRYWYVLRTRNFTWEDAQRLPEASYRKSLGSEDGLDRLPDGDWSLPTIQNLMSLVSRDPIDGYYLDSVFRLHNDPYFFWSRDTADSDPTKAYYIETKCGSVLCDSILGVDRHRKAVILTAKSVSTSLGPLQPYAAGGRARVAKPISDIRSLDRRHSVYLSASLVEYGAAEGVIATRELEKEDFFPLSLAMLGARPQSRRAAIKQTMMNADYYVLLKTDGLADVWQTVHEEISCAEEMGVPIVVVEYRWAGKPQVAMKNEAFAQHVSQGGVASVLAGVLEGLRNYQNTPAIAPLGWLRSDTYAALDAAATEINRINRAFLEAQPLIRDFVGCCNVTSLLETFTSEGILLPKQRFGTCVKFASKEMPISRFSHADGNGVGNVEILFNLIPNRFEQLENPDVVFDTYLNLYWMRRPPKHLSYSAAIEAVSKCNACGLNWRLPKAAEIITLLTHEYGGRKFMDEEVFPIGRWYWLGDPPVRNGDQECAYYADFNYQAGLIDVEPLPTDGAMVKMRLKSALFVSEKVDPVMSI